MKTSFTTNFIHFQAKNTLVGIPIIREKHQSGRKLLLASWICLRQLQRQPQAMPHHLKYMLLMNSEYMFILVFSVSPINLHVEHLLVSRKTRILTSKKLYKMRMMRQIEVVSLFSFASSHFSWLLFVYNSYLFKLHHCYFYHVFVWLGFHM